MNDNITIGFAITGSYCTFSKVIPEIDTLKKLGYNIIPIFSENAASVDTRFGKAKEHILKVEEITGNHAITSIAEAEPIGPKKILDILIIAPCTGNTLAKLANGIADSSVTLAAKSHLRNGRPIVVAVSTNDGLGANAKNIGALLSRKHIFMAPFGQDDYKEKANSLVAHFDQLPETISFALQGKQIQPILQ